MHGMPAQKGLDVAYAERAPLPVELLVEFRLRDVERIQSRETGGFQVNVPVEAPRKRLQTPRIRLVEQLVRIAALRAGGRGPGQRPFDLHDFGGFPPPP